MSATTDTHRDDLGSSFIGVLRRIDAAAGEEGLTVGEITDRLDERAFGLLILLLTLPCLVPGLPGAQIIAIGIFLLAVQVLIGRSEPWLPGWFMRARVKKSWLSSIAGFADKRLRWTETFSRPRWRFFAVGFGEKIAALVMALAAITVMLPITNTVPSAALTLMSVGLIQRDGVFSVLGMLVALGWLTLLGILIAGLIVGAGFAVDLISEHAPWLAGLFGG
jgi:hypothetical protein